MRRRILQSMLIVIGLVIGLSVLTASPKDAWALGPTPSPSPTPTSAEAYIPPPMAWPVKPPTEAQFNELDGCNMTWLATERYPGKIGIDALKDAYRLETTCDKAVLAVAYAARVEEGQPLPAVAKRAFLETIAANVAFAYTVPLMNYYMVGLEVVEAPPIAKQTITQVEIKHRSYQWGDSITYEVIISKADTDRPVVSGQATESISVLAEGYTPTSTPMPPHSVTGTLDSALVQALGPALTDLLPTGALFSYAPCWGDDVDWTVELTFRDGTKLEVLTKGSGYVPEGGPWQTTIDQQTYMQYSAAFFIKIHDIVKALKLPQDGAREGCGGLVDPLGFFPDIPRG